MVAKESNMHTSQKLVRGVALLVRQPTLINYCICLGQKTDRISKQENAPFKLSKGKKLVSADTVTLHKPCPPQYAYLHYCAW